MEELIGLVVLVILFLIGLVTPIAGIGYLIDRTSCFASTAQIGYQARYGIWTGCQIEVDGKWIPLSAYYVQDKRQEQRKEGE